MAVRFYLVLTKNQPAADRLIDRAWTPQISAKVPRRDENGRGYARSARCDEVRSGRRCDRRLNENKQKRLGSTLIVMIKVIWMRAYDVINSRDCYRPDR